MKIILVPLILAFMLAELLVVQYYLLNTKIYAARCREFCDPRKFTK